MTPIYKALITEANFTSDLLESGVTAIGKANYTSRGKYFEAFNSLSIGLERIGKLCLLLDYYIENKGKFPNDKNIRSFGHDLIKIYQKSFSVVSKHNLKLSYTQDLSDPIHQSILNILSNFAKGDRYSNINLLTADGNPTDPIKNWYNHVDCELFEKKVSTKKKMAIQFNAKLFGESMKDHGVVYHLSETGDVINNFENSSFKTGMTNSITKYRILYVAQIVRYWVEILRGLQYIAFKISKEQEIPWMSESFTIFNNDDSYLLTRKSFDRLR